MRIEPEKMSDHQLIELMNNPRQQPFHAACNEHNYDLLEFLLKKYLHFLATEKIQPLALEARNGTLSVLAAYYTTLTYMNPIPYQHVKICNYFMLARANLISNGTSILPLIKPKSTQRQLQNFLAFCGRDLIAAQLQQIMTELKQPEFFVEVRPSRGVFAAQIATKVMSTDEIFQTCSRIFTSNKGINKKLLKHIQRSEHNETFLILFDINNCPSVTNPVTMSFDDPYFAQLCSTWLNFRPTQFELILSELIDCFIKGCKYFNEYHDPDKQGFGHALWNYGVNFVYNDVNLSSDIMNMIVQYNSMNKSSALEMLQWLRTIMKHECLATKHHQKSLWRHIVRAIHENPHIQMYITLKPLRNDQERHRHNKLCNDNNIAPTYPLNTKLVCPDTFRQTDGYRTFYYSYLLAWIEHECNLAVANQPTVAPSAKTLSPTRENV